MPRLSKRLRCELVILSALATGSCSDFHTMGETYEMAEFASFNARNALARCNDLEGRVSEIERKLRN